MEDVRMLVQEEGRAARNLIAFHVDVASPLAGKSVNRKPPSSPRLLNEARMTKRSSVVVKTGSRVRSASTGRDKKSELQARYWAFLFGNLQRAVDEIYQTCETDESVSECKEVILVLENFTRDFHNLIEWFKLKWEYENTSPPQRPTSLAWEVRKSSPGKVMTTSRIDKINRTDKQSPVKKQLNFFSDVKLSSAEECPKKAFTLENELSNKYGLSFGDLEEHLQYGETISEVSNNNNQNLANLPSTKPDTRAEEINKENCPKFIGIANDSCKTLAEVASSKSSQTDEIALHSLKVPLKSIPTSAGPTPKKPQPTVKSAFGSVVKTSTLSPLCVSKTGPAASFRKTVPVSPTSTVPPRMIPGRNVAAVTFVPSKKLAQTSQAKINTNLNRSTNNLSKTSNISPQPSEKGVNEGLKNSLAVDTNKLVEQEKIAPTKEAIDNRITDSEVTLTDKTGGIMNQDLINVSNSSLNIVNMDKTEVSVSLKVSSNAEKPMSNSTVVVGEAKTTVKEDSRQTLSNQAINRNIPNIEKKVNNHIMNVKEKQNEAQSNVTTLKVPCLKDNSLQEKLKAKSESTPVKNLNDKSNSLGGNLNYVNSVKTVKLMKLDKSIQTDLSHLAQIAAAKQTAKATTLVRNKTAPSFTRKSNEMLAPPEPTLETSKTVKNTTAYQPRTIAPVLKKQSSVPEANNEKTVLEKLVEKSCSEKSTVEKAISTKMAFPPLKQQVSAAETNGEKIANEKQANEKFSNEKPTMEKAIATKPAFPPLTNQPNAPEKLSREKHVSEKPSSEKSVCDKATSPKPAYAAVSKVYRSNTAIELRPRVVYNRTITPVKPLGSEKQNNDKASDEKQASVKSSSEKSRNEKTPTNVTGAPKVYRSSTSIELRPRVSFNRSVAGATVKSESQLSKIRGMNHSIRNPSLMKKSKPLFKSEQNLQKKNSIDEDGWETVKGRNRWKLSQSSGNIKGRTPNSRFHLPSPATSLPALALASDCPGSDPKPAKLHKDRQNQEIAKANRVALRNKSQLTSKSISKSEPESVSHSGKKGKKDDEIEIENKLSDRKKTSNGKGKDVKKTLNGVKQEDNNSKIDKLMDILSSEDEKMNEEEIRKSRELYEKEQKLTKEIQDLEKSEIEVDTETEDAETDGETNVGSEEDDTNCRINALKASYEDVCSQLSWADQMDTLEKLEKLMANDTSTKGIPWDERLSTLEQLEELVARHPGRALELHQKLSSPSRRRHLPDTLQRHRERQESAQLKREQLLQDKTNKMRELLNKVEEVQKQQAQLKEVRRKRIAEKLKRAEENRALHIRSIQRKAHDEDEKLREIMFINELEAQNKRHDFFASCQEKEGRLQGIHDERQRKQEEKAAKEAAVEERRRILEAERQERLEQMQEKRRKREERIGREQQEKEKERQELAREKQRDHEKRIQAIHAMHQANTEELQKKIQQKQVDSARRHEENIEHIRQRALESGALRGAADDEAPCLTPYDTYKLCTKCNILIESEVYLLSHLRGKAHQEAVKDLKDDSEPVIIDAPPDKMDAKLAQDRERQKALRKRCKKIRSRMAQRGEEYLSKLSLEGGKKLDSPNKMRLFKCLRNVDKLHSSQGLGQWPDNAVTLLERNLAEINRILDKQNELDQKVFQDLNGFTTLSNILNLGLDIPKNMSPYLPPKCFLTTCMVYSLACAYHPGNSRFVVFSNKVSLVLDLLLNRLNTLITDDYRTSNKSSTNLPVDPVAGALMKLFALILSHSQENVPDDVPDMAPRLQDIISYTVSVGVVDKLALYCSSVRDPIDDNPMAAQFLLNAIQLLTTLAQTKCALVKGDPTQLVATLRVTELVGGVSMLYGMLLHQGAPPSSPPSLPLHTVCVTQATLQLLKAVAQLDLSMFQSVLGAEGISLQLRHIASYLLWYCSHPGCGDNGGSSDTWLEDKRDLLHQVIEVVGYFAVNHYDNQMMLQSGHMPTVLQQLCNLPFGYFSDPSLSCHLLPSLLACCHGNQENKTILEQELNYQLLEDFRKSEAARSNPLVQLIK